MKKYLSAALIAGAAVLGTAVYLTAPEKSKIEQKRPFWGRNFAHRGLHNEETTIPENSLSAFDRAAEAGYGIEMDVHITADDRIVVFHDDTLERVCGVEGRVEECMWNELKGLSLCDSNEGMPLLSDVLALIDGRVPIILELKSDERRDELCERTLEYLRCYAGDVCVESFDPRIVGWFRKYAPDILRGQLSQPPKNFDELSRLEAFALGNLLTNCIARPNFVAYRNGKKPLLVRLCSALGAMKVCWTAQEPSPEEKNDAVIFEFYKPSQRFK